jgi:hypothetical protein
MTQELEPYTGHFPPETVQLALRVMAEAGGNSRIAHERLTHEFAEHIERLPAENTINYWRTTAYPQRYRQIVNEHDGQLEDIVKAQLRTSQIQAGEVQAQAIQRLSDNVNNLPIDKLSTVTRDLATSRAIDLDKLRLLEDKPTLITETRDAPEILHSLAQRLNIIDSTAVELTTDEHDTHTETSQPVGS